MKKKGIITTLIVVLVAAVVATPIIVDRIQTKQAKEAEIKIQEHLIQAKLPKSYSDLYDRLLHDPEITPSLSLAYYHEIMQAEKFNLPLEDTKYYRILENRARQEMDLR